MIDMEMPKHCWDCPCYNGENGECQVTGSRDTYCDEPPRNCPLLPIEPCEETVSREKLIAKIEDIYDSYMLDEGGCCPQDFVNIIEEFPTATPIREESEWTFDLLAGDWICAVCGNHSLEYKDYCPSCSAEMEIKK